MLGNVAEWCRDCYAPSVNATFAEVDGLAILPEGKERRDRVFRGDSFNTSAEGLGTFERKAAEPNQHRFTLGCRPIRPIDHE
jgi:formylglycine-generating enzyme required for sulfatase activity